MIGRRSPLDQRVSVRTRVLVERPEGTVSMETLNLGLGGAYCRSQVSFPLGTVLSCKIRLPGVGKNLAVRVEAQVLRAVLRPDGYRIGLKFTRLNKEIRQALKSFLARSGGSRAGKRKSGD